MYLTTHVLTGAALFGRRSDKARTAAAAFGSLVPDIGSFAIVLKGRLVDGHSAIEIYRDLYYSAAWQAFLAPWHSVFIWGALLAVGVTGAWPLATIFGGAALLASATDLPLHSERTHSHFWPLTDWRFESPVSYWHPEHYGLFVQPVELALAVFLTVLLYRRYESRAAVVLLGIGWIVYAAQFMSYAMLRPATG